MDDVAEHLSSDADYYVVATMHLRHYATYEEAQAALSSAKEQFAAGNSRQRKRAHSLRIYRCHSFGRPCREKKHDGSGFVHVPLEATPEMIDAGFTMDPLGCDVAEDEKPTVYGAIWRAMTEARPDPRSAPPLSDEGMKE